MNSQIQAWMARQWGLVTRQQAVAAGLTAREVDRLVRSGEWIAVRRGIYTIATLAGSLTHRSEQQRLRDDAACLRIGPDFVRSHESAALALGVPVLVPRDGVTHVTRRTVHGSRHEHGVNHHVAPFLPEQVVEISGRLCLEPARTAIDIARFHGHPFGVVAIDSVRRSGVSLSRLHQVLDAQRYWPHVVRARAECDQSVSLSESVGETLARLLVTELGFGVPECQFGLGDGEREAWADLRLGRHLFEFDGAIKYHRTFAGGVADRDPTEVVWEEKRRQDWLCGFKCGMSRLTWSDFGAPARSATRARLTREYLDTCARFGTEIDDLAAYILPQSRRYWAR